MYKYEINNLDKDKAKRECRVSSSGYFILFWKIQSSKTGNGKTGIVTFGKGKVNLSLFAVEMMGYVENPWKSIF